MLTPSQFYGPATAIAFYHNDFLIAGHGPLLRIFNWKTAEQITEYRIFERNCVRGLFIAEDEALVWGATSFAVVSLTDALEQRKTAKECHSFDWIFSGIVHNETIYLLTAHNVVLAVDKESHKVIQTYSCIEDPMLYSGDLAVKDDRIHVASGTIFGPILVWSLDSLTPRHRLVGHVGSIFAVKWSADLTRLATGSDDRSIKLWDVSSGRCLSAGWGHDARVWALQFIDNNTLLSSSEDCTCRVWRQNQTLQCTDNRLVHVGKHAWNVAFNCRSRVYASCGGDGAVFLNDIDLTQHIALPDTTIDKSLANGHGTAWKGFTDYAPRCLLAATDTGAVMRLSLRPEPVASLLVEPATINSNTSISTWPHSTLSCFSDGEGSLVVFCHNTGRIYAHWTHGTAKRTIHLCRGSADTHYLFSQSSAPGDSLIMDVFDFSATGLSNHSSVHLTTPAAFLTSSTCVLETQGLIVAGSRLGSIAVYSLNHTQLQYTQSGVLSQGSAVTSLTATDTGSVLCTTRDGFYALLDIAEDKLVITHSSKVAKGSIEGGRLFCGSLYLWGFRTNTFVFWNATEHYTYFSVVCGGIHRAWAFVADLESNCARFTFAKAGALHQVERPIRSEKFAQSSLTNAFHGREVRSIKFSPHGDVLATGAEDTLIRLSTVTSDGRIETKTVLNHHVSGIQDMAWAATGRYLFSSGGREELYAWKVEWNKPVLAASMVSAAPKFSENADLRITGLCTFTDELVQYTAGCFSDSSICVWRFENETFVPAVKGVYRSCCLLNIDVVEADDKRWLVLTATDGYVIVYALDLAASELLSPALTVKVHQSGIKGYVRFAKGRDSWYILCGGDDCAIAVVEFTVAPTATAKVVSVKRSAHSSCITGLIRTSLNEFVSISEDQNVRKWRVSEGELELLESHYTCIADTGSGDYYEKCLVIGGSGISTWTEL
ncbi:hypothetical protein CANCADRAFT_108452 [Tortispora caseinolytica NRRL Y-17796]|uniref:Anaphase-promoting complex subunit 4 WD40 domain-containing protein n=1 Tax=Tortispora caseinolytica NRRL Y-17796 TaxID=767744 RepID=A0A1E4TFY5_9ASCO|nr:hypothetical protein CANCADRAFT_108452 [Tortispora caseinolytica NRRL Y-17796]